MAEYKLDLDEYRKFYEELMRQAGSEEASTDGTLQLAGSDLQVVQANSDKAEDRGIMTMPLGSLEERKLDFRPKQHVPYKKTQEAKLMASFCQIVLSRLQN